VVQNDSSSFHMTEQVSRRFWCVCLLHSGRHLTRGVDKSYLLHFVWEVRWDFWHKSWSLLQSVFGGILGGKGEGRVLSQSNTFLVITGLCWLNTQS